MNDEDRSSWRWRYSEMVNENTKRATEPIQLWNQTKLALPDRFHASAWGDQLGSWVKNGESALIDSVPDFIS